MRHLPATEEGAGTGDHRKAVTGSRHARRTGRACPGPDEESAIKQAIQESGITNVQLQNLAQRRA